MVIQWILDASGFKKGAREVEEGLRSVSEKTSHLKNVQLESAKAFTQQNKNLEETYKKTKKVGTGIAEMIRDYRMATKGVEEHVKQLRVLVASLDKVDLKNAEKIKEKIDLIAESMVRLQSFAKDVRHELEKMGVDVDKIIAEEKAGKLKELVREIPGLGYAMGLLRRYGVAGAAVAIGGYLVGRGLRTTMELRGQMLGLAPLAGAETMERFLVERATAIGRPWETRIYRWGYRAQETLAQYEELIRAVGMRSRMSKECR